MVWCEANRVDFVFGLARNPRLVAEIAVEILQAEAEATATGKPARRFKDFRYATLDSWSRRRRVIGKAEWTEGEANPQFIVTSLTKAEANGHFLYEKIYCARGEMENRIKECQGDLFADRTSTATLRANQLRLWLASFAYVLICAVRPSASPTLSSPTRPAARSGSSSSSSPASSASARGASSSPSPRPAPMPTNGASPPPVSPEASPRRRPNRGNHTSAHRRPQQPDYPAQTAPTTRTSMIPAVRSRRPGSNATRV